MNDLKEGMETVGLMFILMFLVVIPISLLTDTADNHEHLGAFFTSPSLLEAYHLWPGIFAGLLMGVLGILLVVISHFLPRNGNGDHPAKAG